VSKLLKEVSETVGGEVKELPLRRKINHEIVLILEVVLPNQASHKISLWRVKN
jgi:hypothetical protein